MALKEAPLPAPQRTPRPDPPKMQRQDMWWIQPLLTALVLGGFAVYATWRTFENAHYLYTGATAAIICHPFTRPPL